MDLDSALGSAAAVITPVAVRDDGAMARNIAAMATLAGAAGLALRPHAKTHKSTAVARRQLDAGARGLTVATLQEAEVFAASGVNDIFIAHPPVGAEKQRRLALLAARGTRLAVALDDVNLARGVPPGVDILWEVDTGLHRVGTAPGVPTVEAVRRLLEVVDRRRFRGLMTHGGHAYRAVDPTGLRAAAAQEALGVAETAALLRAEGIAVAEVSVGSTPTAGLAGEQTGLTEMRPGTYVYADAGQVTLGTQSLGDCALVVVASVISTPEKGRAVLDAGSKSISADRTVAALGGYGLILGHPHLVVERLSEEHAVLTVAAGGATGLRVGDRVAVVPAHVCTTVNLHAALLCFDGRRGQSYWEAVDARGWRPYDAGP